MSSTFAIYNIHNGVILDEVTDPGDAFDRLVELEDETGQDLALREMEETK